MRCFIVFCFLLGAFSCNNKDVQPASTTTVLSTTSQIGQTTERLNSDYNIQFPADYEGTGAVGFEGLIFNKYRKDGRTKLAYAFCGTTFCSEYGGALPNPLPSTVSHNKVTLDKSVVLKHNEQVQAIFYYAEQSKTFGLLYLLKDGQFKESINVQYEYSLHTEVLGILQTIKPK